MAIDEKKFKLDELPDEGSDSVPQTPPQKKLKKSPEDPRVTQLKKADDKTKIQIMEQTWIFDDREKNYGWVLFILILGILEFTPFYQQYLNELDIMNSIAFGVGGDIIRDYTHVFEAFIRHPAILILLTPLFFSFSKTSDYVFELGFDGISTVKKYVPVGSKEMVSRTFVKWKEIERIEKVAVGDKEILRIFSLDGHIADIIWYIDIDKKRAIKVLLNGLIHPKHPMRAFLDNEKELK